MRITDVTDSYVALVVRRRETEQIQYSVPGPTPRPSRVPHAHGHAGRPRDRSWSSCLLRCPSAVALSLTPPPFPDSKSRTPPSTIHPAPCALRPSPPRPSAGCHSYCASVASPLDFTSTLRTIAHIICCTLLWHAARPHGFRQMREREPLSLKLRWGCRQFRLAN